MIVKMARELTVQSSSLVRENELTHLLTFALGIMSTWVTSCGTML